MNVKNIKIPEPCSYVKVLDERVLYSPVHYVKVTES